MYETFSCIHATNIFFVWFTRNPRKDTENLVLWIRWDLEIDASRYEGDGDLSSIFNYNSRGTLKRTETKIVFCAWMMSYFEVLSRGLL